MTVAIPLQPNLTKDTIRFLGATARIGGLGTRAPKYYELGFGVEYEVQTHRSAVAKSGKTAV
eukprot:1532019-Rhodomonas_salina.5